MLKYLKYLTLVASVLDAAKLLRAAKPCEANSPLSVNGVHGTLAVTWTPDTSVGDAI